jgi:hypothetical protein
MLYAQTNITQPSIEQPEDRTKAAVEALANSYPLRFGVLRILPRLTLNSGYDSNALFTENEVIGDYFVSASPGADVGVKLGHRAFVRVLEDLTFLYYRKIDQRRDIFNGTKADITTGNSKIIAVINGSYVKRKAPVDEEIDIPVENANTTAGVGFSYFLGTRLNFRPGIQWSQTTFDLSNEVNDIALSLNDHRVLSGLFGLDYLFSPKLQFTGDFRLGRNTSNDVDQTNIFWNALFGARFTGLRLLGSVAAGVGQANFGDTRKRNTFLIDASLDYQVNNRLGVGGMASRQYETSAFLTDSLRLTTQGGVRTSVRITKRLSANAGYKVGVNDYGNSMVAGQQVNNDHFESAFLGGSFRIFKSLAIRVSGNYNKRDSDIRLLNKRRFTYEVGLGFSYTLNSQSDDEDDQ